MRVVKLSWRYILRHPIKTFIIYALVALMGTVLLTSMMVRAGTQTAEQELTRGAGAGFHLSLSQTATSYTPRGLAKIKPADAEKIAQIKGVDTAYMRQSGAARIEGSLVQIPGRESSAQGKSGDDSQGSNKDSSVPSSTARSEEWASGTTIDGMNDSRGHTGFRTGEFKLTEGRHIESGDKHTILINEALAKLNGWKVGDTITLHAISSDPENELQSSATVQAKIVGLFSGDNTAKAADYRELYANQLISDSTTSWEIYGLSGKSTYYTDVSYSTDGSRSVSDIIAEAKKMNLDWSNVDLIANSDYFQTINAAISSLANSTTLVAALACIFAGGVITLMFALWQGARKREVGVLYSLGFSPRSVMMQRILEVLFVSIPSFATAIGVSYLVAPHFSRSALESANRAAKAQLGTIGNVGANIETAQATTSLESLTVSLTPQVVMIGGIILLAIMVAALLLSSVSLMRRSPRELIGSMA